MIKAGYIFTDRAVLQCNMPIPVWGETDASALSVSFNGTTVPAEIKDGKFRATLPATGVNVRGELRIFNENEEFILSDVVTGEVWVAGGQSNMEHPNICAAVDPATLEDDPDLRLFTVPRRTEDAARVGWHFEGLYGEDTPWEYSDYETALHFSSIAYAFGRRLRKELGVPVGIISCNWGGTPAEAWVKRELLDADPEFAAYGERWDARFTDLDLDAYRARDIEYQEWLRDYIKERGPIDGEVARLGVDASLRYPGPTRWTEEGPLHPCVPGGLRKYMLARVTPYALRGAIWHQGESNARGGQADTRTYYTRLMQTLIADWRESFESPDMAFGIVGLATFGGGEPDKETYCRIREAQADLADGRDPLVYTVPSADLGERDNIHPARKPEMGERLALGALAKVYGLPTVWEGPKPTGMICMGENIEIVFDRPVTTPDETPGDFFCHTDTGERVLLPAAIDGEGSIRLTLPEGTVPTEIGYVLQNWCRANLFGEDGLAVSPFLLKI